MQTTVSLDVPIDVCHIITTLHKHGYEGYLVGGCVRDLLMNRTPSDWDVTTNASPENIQEIFDHTFYENDFGTVGVVNDSIGEQIASLPQDDVSRETLEKLKTVEVTPYRRELGYSDSRHPDQVVFTTDLSEDLSRRDFTINAMAYNPLNKELIDLHQGVQDLQKKEIKTVGNPDERFTEDALRLIRAVRFATQLGFHVSRETQESIKMFHVKLAKISQERIREEFNKIILSDQPREGLDLLKDLNLLPYVIPELLQCLGVEQNGSHVYDVYEHLLRTLQHAADKQWSLEIRLAALLHDISKPETRGWSQEKKDYTFYGHEVVGARESRKILKRLRYSKEIVSRVTLLVRWHMFFSDPDQITLSAVRRIIRNVGGGDQVWDLIKLRICDRIGMGRPKEEPYRLRQYEAMMEEAMRSPVSVRDLKINGDQIMAMFHVKPGKKIGWILHACMAETLHKPENNNFEYLVKHVSQLVEMSDQELETLYSQGKKAIDQAEEAELTEIRKKHRVGKRR